MRNVVYRYSEGDPGDRSVRLVKLLGTAIQWLLDQSSKSAGKTVDFEAEESVTRHDDTSMAERTPW